MRIHTLALLTATVGSFTFSACLSSSSSSSHDSGGGLGGALYRDGGGVAGSTGAGGLGLDGAAIAPGTGGRGAGGVAIGVGGVLGTGGGAAGTSSTARDGGVAGAGGRASGGADASIAGAGGRDASIAGAGGKGGSGTGGVAAGTGGGAGGSDGGTVTAACAPAVTRGGQYFTFAEKFNRYYTDCAWQPSSTVYVSPDGTGDGSSRTSAASVTTALADAKPGEKVVFVAGTYSGCYELSSDQSGTYDNPIVLYGERKADGALGVKINCCTTGLKACINLEQADYVAIDGFELVGGDRGVRAVGADGFAANEHQKGIAVLNSIGHDQYKDPFFTGQSDWFVIERCKGYDVGTGDGHGIYLSNGSDWNIARWNETYSTNSSDFQINADPLMCCEDEGIAFDDPECDAVAGTHPTGGRGASDYMLVEGNFFHHSKAQGPNFTSVRNSIVKNNIFAFSSTHGTSFWQQTDNPKLGASSNLIAHNLFITSSGRHALQLINSSTGNQVKNNVILAVSISGTTVSGSANGLLLDTDSSTVAANTFEKNAWASGYFDTEDSADPYEPNAAELRLTTVDAAWFTALPRALASDAAAYAPTATAPWLDKGNLLPEVPIDRNGSARHAPTDLGPFER